MRTTIRSLWLCAPYDVALKGFENGPKAVIGPPKELALACLTEALPFTQSALVVIPQHDRLSEAVAATFRSTFSEVYTTTAAEFLKSDDSRPEGSSLPNKLAKEFDVVCFASGSVLQPEGQSPPLPDPGRAEGSGLASSARLLPHMVSVAQRRMHPLGIITFTGQRRLRVVAPQPAAADFDDFLRFIDDDASTTAAADAALRDASWSSQRALQRSMDNAHADWYLPFPHVRRRWFESEYEVTPLDVAAHIRTWPSYQQSRAARHDVASHTLGVIRRSTIIDPLESLCGLMEVHAAAGGNGGKLRVQLDSFVITCDSRPLNARQPRYESLGGSAIPQLPSSRGKRHS